MDKYNNQMTMAGASKIYLTARKLSLIQISEGILSSAAMELLGTYELEWMGEKIDLTPGWRRMTMAEAVKEYAGVDFAAISGDEEAVAAARAGSPDCRSGHSRTPTCRRPVSVSYTHLDVYKRQLQHRIDESLKETGQPQAAKHEAIAEAA